MADINELLKEATKDLLTPESLTLIEQAINAKVDEKAKLQVEAALIALDEKHSTMLQKLMEKMDTDYTVKLEKLIKRLDESYAAKLMNVKNVYDKKLKVADGQLTTEATKYVGDLQTRIDNFLDAQLSKVLPEATLKEAVENVKAQRVLAQIRELVGINEEVIRKDVKDAMIDGKRQIDESKQQLDKIITENAELKKLLESKEAQLLLEQKTAILPSKKRAHVRRILAEKDVKFINENFTYVCEMYDREDVVNASKAKQEVKPHAKEVDTPQVIVESTEKPSNDPEQNRVASYLKSF